MKIRRNSWRAAAWLILAAAWICGAMTAAASGSNDNSLASLGILTEGAQVSPEFGYGVTEYDVTVPAGTQELELDPVPSDENAWIVEINGTELTDGAATVEIVVSAENGEQYPYYLHVTEEAGGAAPAPVAETEPVPQTEKETEPETMDPRYALVDRSALEEASNTITALKDETRNYRDRSTMLMRILYGMIAFCVVLLFIVINQILRKKDLKAELQEYMGYGYPPRGRGAVDTAAKEPEPQAKPEPPRRRDDPSTVPKPSKAKKQPKKMPEYQQPQPPQQRGYRKPEDSRPEDVEVTMIDL